MAAPFSQEVQLSKHQPFHQEIISSRPSGASASSGWGSNTIGLTLSGSVECPPLPISQYRFPVSSKCFNLFDAALQKDQGIFFLPLFLGLCDWRSFSQWLQLEKKQPLAPAPELCGSGREVAKLSLCPPWPALLC